MRPFFLEGQEIFDTPGFTNLVHTKTIVDPQIGGKLTGKAGNTTLGVLVANDEAPGKFDDPDAHGFGQTAQFLIGRARYDLYAESYVGAIMTDREFLDSYSRVAGVDGRFRMGQTHSAEFLAVGSSNRDLEGGKKSGPMFNAAFRRDGRQLSYRLRYNQIDPTSPPGPASSAGSIPGGSTPTSSTTGGPKAGSSVGGRNSSTCATSITPASCRTRNSAPTSTCVLPATSSSAPTDGAKWNASRLRFPQDAVLDAQRHPLQPPFLGLLRHRLG